MKNITTILLCLANLTFFSQESWIKVEVQPDNYPSETSWEIINSSGEVIATNPPITDMSLQTTVIPLDSEDYNFVIYDDFGDGICCAYGEGWFGLSNDCGLEEYVYDFGGATATVFFTLEQCAQPPPDIIGCMDPTATNYNPEAGQNSYTGPVVPTPCNSFYPSNYNYFGIDLDYYNENQSVFAIGTEISVGGFIYYIDGTSIPNNCNLGVAMIYVVSDESLADGNLFDTMQVGALVNDLYEDDAWTINPCEYIYGCNNPLAINYDPIATSDDGSCDIISGCMDNSAINYNPAAVVEQPPGNPGPPPCEYFVLDTSSCGVDSVELIVEITIDQYPEETSWYIMTNWNEDQIVMEVLEGDYSGLTMGTTITHTACVVDNANFTFRIFDSYGDGLGGAQWGGIDGEWMVYTACDTIASGIGDFGFNAMANGNTGDCDDLPIEGCMDNNYVEYDPEAVLDNGSCLTAKVYGCIDEDSINYDVEANTAEQFSTCVHTLTLTDLSANGWGGSFLIVTQGENYYGPYTVASGEALFTIDLDFNSNELIKAFFYTDPLSAFFANECGFEVTGPSGEVVVFGGDNPILRPIRFSPYMYSGLGQCLETCIPMVYGCTDVEACNYDSDANTLSSCTYNIEYYNCNNQCNSDSDVDGICDELEVVGCQDPLQYNFNPLATDAGECEAFVYGCTDNLMFNFNPEANTENNSCIPIVNGCTDIAAFNYNILANIDNNTCVAYAYGCIDITAFNYDILANTDDGTCIPYLYGCTDAGALNFNLLANTDDNSCIPYLYGCTDDTAMNYNDLANTDDDSCIPFIYGCTDSSMWNYSLIANTDDGSCISFIYGCIDPLMFNFDISANTDNDTCIPYIYGCLDPTMFNYNAEANSDNDSCEPFVYGCTNEMAFNYNPAANAEYEPTNCEPFVYGCTDPSMLNYNSEANTEDFSCIDYIYGCTDPLAFNYDPLANTENGSCIEILEGCADPEAYNYEALVNIPDPEDCLYEAVGCVTGLGEPYGDGYWLNDECYSWVIDVDPYCCTTAWDGSCVELYVYCGGDVTSVGEIDIACRIFPNPTQGVLNIKSPYDVTTTIYDMLGKQVLPPTTETFLRLNSLSNGMYEVRVEYNDRVINTKIIKQ